MEPLVDRLGLGAALTAHVQHAGTAEAAAAELLHNSAANTSRLDSTIHRAMNASYHDGTGAWNSTAVRWWIKYHIARGEDPFHVHGPDASVLDKLDDEKRLMRFVVWLACEKEPTVAIDTAKEYASTVQGWLARNLGFKLGAGMQLHRVSQLAKGLHRLRGGRPMP